MNSKVATVTTKGQATIPSRMGKKYTIRRKVAFTEAKEAILIRPIPDLALKWIHSGLCLKIRSRPI